MHRQFKADLDAPGLREKLYEQMDQSLVMQVNDILSQFNSELASSKPIIEAKTREGKISVTIPDISEELQEKIKAKLNGLGARENYKIMLS